MYVVEKVVLGYGFFSQFFSFLLAVSLHQPAYLHFIFLPPLSCSLKNLRRIKRIDLNSGPRGKLCPCDFSLFVRTDIVESST